MSRYLLLKDREYEARQSIRHYYNCTNANQIDKVVVEIRENLSINSKSMSIISVFHDATARRATLVGSTVAFGMAFTGIAGECVCMSL